MGGVCLERSKDEIKERQLPFSIPAEVKHWHGAAKGSWMQHLTYHKDVQDGASNEWQEAVSDDEYNKL